MCYSFATAAAVESWQAITSNAAPVSLSMQQVIDCGSNSGCSGGPITSSLGYAAQGGLCPLAAYPYKSAKGTCASSSCTASPGSKPSSYSNIAANSQAALEASVKVGPTVVAVCASQAVWQKRVR